MIFSKNGSAGIIKQSMLQFYFIAYLKLWGTILPEIDDAQLYLQQEGLGLDSCQRKINALKNIFEFKRNEVVSNALASAITMSEEFGIPIEQRIRKKKKMPGEKADDASLSLQDSIRRELFEILDRLREEMTGRFNQIEHVNALFGFLSLEQLQEENDPHLTSKIEQLCSFYDEIDASNFKDEIKRMRQHIQPFKADIQKLNVCGFLQWIVKWGLVESFPNIVLSLRIFLTICISVAICERSFSKLKLILSYLRSKMSQTRLDSLAIISIERTIAENLDFEECIDTFSSLKSRKIWN